MKQLNLSAGMGMEKSLKIASCLLEKKPGVAFKDFQQGVAMGSREDFDCSELADKSGLQKA